MPVHYTAPSEPRERHRNEQNRLQPAELEQCLIDSPPFTLIALISFLSNPPALTFSNITSSTSYLDHIRPGGHPSWCSYRPDDSKRKEPLLDPIASVLLPPHPIFRWEERNVPRVYTPKASSKHRGPGRILPQRLLPYLTIYPTANFSQPILPLQYVSGRERIGCVTHILRVYREMLLPCMTTYTSRPNCTTQIYIN